MKQFYLKFERKSFFTLLLGLSLLVGIQGIKAATITSTAVGGDWNSTSTWEGGVVPANSTADYVIILGSATVTLNLTVAFSVGALDINQGGTLNVSSNASTNGFTIGTKAPGSTIAGALFFDGTVNGTRSFGTVTVTATGSVIETVLKSISLNNGASGILTNYGTITTGTLAMSGTNGNLMNIYNYGTINSTGFSSTTVGTFTNYDGAIFNFNGAIGGNVKNYGTINSSNLSGSSAVAKITNYSTGVINFTGGSMSSTTLVLDATEAGNKVNYIAGVSQTLKDVVYSNLILANAGTKTIPTAASATLCTGTLTISDAAKASITNTNVGVVKLNIGGIVQLDNTYGGASSTATVKNSTYLTGLGYFNVQNTLGVDQFKANELKLYPNPATTGNFTISLPFMQQPSKVSILNVAGQTLYNTTIPAGESSVINPNSKLSAGIYLVKMEQSGKSIAKKLIIN